MYYPDVPIKPTKFLPDKYLLAFLQFIILIFWTVSLVEQFKAIAIWIGNTYWKNNSARLERSRSIGIDTYEFFKWSLLLVAINCSLEYDWLSWVVVYLLASNLFSHFYYHVWRETKVLEVTHVDMMRRLASYLLAFGFMIVGYAYLFLKCYSTEIEWPDNIISISSAMFLSVSNTFTLTYGDYGPLSNGSRFLAASQVCYAFFFLVIIIAKSLPTSK